jgi:hypothetical protein
VTESSHNIIISDTIPPSPLEGLRKNHKNPQSRWLVSELRYEIRTSGLQSRRAKLLDTRFSFQVKHIKDNSYDNYMMEY